MKVKKKISLTPFSKVKSLILSLFDSKVEGKKKWLVLGIILYLQSDRRLPPQGMIGHRTLSRREMNIGRRQPICLSKNLFASYTFTLGYEHVFVYNR